MVAKSLIEVPLRWIGLELRRIQHDRDAVRTAYTLLGAPAKAVIFDVGSNLGQSIEKYVHRFAYPEIHAFEPSPKTFEELKKRTGRLRGVVLHNFALGSQPGKLQFLENSKSDMSSFLQPGADHWGAIEHVTEVQVETLDRYCSERHIDNIDLLKIDTQGFDLEVLRGTKEMLAAKRVKSILIEITFLQIYQTAPRCDEIFRFLFDHGYRLIALYDQVYRRGAIAWADALFML